MTGLTEDKDLMQASLAQDLRYVLGFWAKAGLICSDFKLSELYAVFIYFYQMKNIAFERAEHKITCFIGKDAENKLLALL